MRTGGAVARGAGRDRRALALALWRLSRMSPQDVRHDSKESPPCYATPQMTSSCADDIFSGLPQPCSRHLHAARKMTGLGVKNRAENRIYE